MITLKQGTIEERVSELTLGAGLSITQDASGLATLDISGSSGITQAAADVRYVNIDGDTMTGALNGPTFWATTAVRSGAAGVGFVQLTPGDASNAGYVEWYNASAVRRGYMGYLTTGIALQLESGNFSILGSSGIAFTFGIAGGLTINKGPIYVTALNTSYTMDGLFDTLAIPGVIVTTPGGTDRKLILGYSDGGGGQYTPAIGIQYNAAAHLRFLRVLKAGEANERFAMYTDGTLFWGPGGGSPLDSNLARLSGGGLSTGVQFQGDYGGRFKGWFYTGVTGLAAEVGVSGGEVFFLSYDRTGGFYGMLNIHGTYVRLVADVEITTSGNIQIGPGTTMYTQSGEFYIRAGGNLRLGATGVNDRILLSGTRADFYVPQIMFADATSWTGGPAVGAFQIYVGGNYRLTIGADGTYTYIQSWSSNKLYLNPSGNEVWVGAVLRSLYRTETPEIRASAAGGISFQISSGTIVASYDDSGSWSLTYGLNVSGNVAVGQFITGAANKGILIGNSFFGQQGSGYGEVGYNNSNGAGSQSYKVTDYASRIRFNVGGISFQTAPSGTAGGAITFTERALLTQGGIFSVWGPIYGNAGQITSASATTAGVFYFGDGGYYIQRADGSFSGNLYTNAAFQIATTLWFGSTVGSAQPNLHWDGTYLNVRGTAPFYVNATVPTTYIYSANIYLGPDTVSTTTWARGGFFHTGAYSARFEGAGGGPVGGNANGIEIYAGGIQAYNRSTLQFWTFRFDASAFSFFGTVTFNNGVTFVSTVNLGSAATIGTGSVTLTGSSFFTDNWFRSTLATGWYNATYAVGIYATTAGQVRTYNSAQFYSESSILAATYSQATTYLRAGTYLYLDSNPGSGVIGAYDPTLYRMVYAMGDAYKMPIGGATLTGFYGIVFAHDYTSGYKNITGLSLTHGFGNVINGAVTVFLGTSIWTSGQLYSANVITTANVMANGEIRAGLYAGGGHSAGDITTRRSATTGVLYFGDYTDRYLYYDGTKFIISGGTVTAPDFVLA